MSEVRDIPRKGLATDAIERALDYAEQSIGFGDQDGRRQRQDYEMIQAARAQLRDIAIAAQQERVGGQEGAAEGPTTPPTPEPASRGPGIGFADRSRVG